VGCTIDPPRRAHQNRDELPRLDDGRHTFASICGLDDQVPCLLNVAGRESDYEWKFRAIRGIGRSQTDYKRNPMSYGSRSFDCRVLYEYLIVIERQILGLNMKA
jgi:hypothetical protein